MILTAFARRVLANSEMMSAIEILFLKEIDLFALWELVEVVKPT